MIEMPHHEILIGATKNEIVKLEIDMPEPKKATDRDTMSISGTTYSRTLIDERTGEEMALEYLSDGEMWRICVEDGTTTNGLDDFNEDVLNTQGWESVLGDVTTVWGEGGECMYATTVSGGQIDMHIKPHMFVITNPVLSDMDVRFIWWFWKTYHMKKMSEIRKENVARLREIVERAEMTTDDEIYYYRACELSNKNRFRS